jgi:hypothetical protein
VEWSAGGGSDLCFAVPEQRFSKVEQGAGL